MTWFRATYNEFTVIGSWQVPEHIALQLSATFVMSKTSSSYQAPLTTCKYHSMKLLNTNYVAF